MGGFHKPVIIIFKAGLISIREWKIL